MRKLLSLLTAVVLAGSMWAATTYEQLTSIANIDEEAEYVLGIDGTGFHYEGTSSWGKTALPTAQTPIVYTLKKAQDGNSFTAEATIGETKYYLQVPTSNTFSMATSAGTNTDLIIGTTQVSGTNYAVANKTTTTRHLRINGASGLRSYAGTTGTMAFFYKVVNSGPSLVSVAVSEIPNTTTYEEGNVFDIDGLVVTGTYSAGDPAVISEGITWKARTNSTSDDEVALENYHLTAGQTSLQVQATVSAIASEWYTVSGLTVNEHTVTPGEYDIVFANAFWGTSGTGANAGHTASGTKYDITISISGSSGTQNYINDTETRIYGEHTLTFSVPSGYVLTEITGLGTEAKSAISVADGSTGSIENRVWTGSANSVTFAIGGRTDFTTVSVTYEAATPSVSGAPAKIEFGDVLKNSGESEHVSSSFTLQGEYLTANVNLSAATAPSGAIFSVYPTSITPEDFAANSGEIEVTVYAQTSSVGEYAGTLTISSAKATPEFTAMEVSLAINVLNEAIAVTSVELDESSIDLEIGATATLTPTVKPNNATNKNVTWESSNPSIATVDNGVVTAVAKGSATITCKSAEDATKKATCSVTVTATEYVKVKSAPADWSGEYLLVYEGKIEEITYAYVWTGADSVNCYALTSISSDKITKPAKAVTLTIASMEGGYSVLINGGTNDGKYLGAFNSSNANINVSVDAVATTLSYDGENKCSQMTPGTKYMRFNKSAGQMRFRGYSASGQEAVQLYKKDDGSATSLEDVETSVKAVKVLRDGQIFILRGEKVYTIQGQLVK